MADEQDQEVTYEEVAEEPAPHVIETGDSVKVKQVLDDATSETLITDGFVPNYFWENLKLFFMFLSCVFAMIAQFYPIPFPSSRPLLGFCCAMYFLLSTVLQGMITYIDKDIILIGKADKETGKVVLIRTNFQRFQEYFEVIIQYQDIGNKGPPTCATTAKMYVGKYFTIKGEFYEAGYARDLLKHMQRFKQQKYKLFEYNHKSD